MIKSFEEYIQTTNEGLFDVFKMMKQFTALQADVTAKYEEEKNEHKLKEYAEEAYNKYIVDEGLAKSAKSFDDWWKAFKEALERFNK